MRKNLKLYPLLLTGLLIMLLTGCRHHKEVGDTISTIDGSPIQSAIDKGHEPEATAPKLVQANFTCEVEGWKIRCQARMCRDSVIWVNANKMIDLGRALLTPDSVLVYVGVNNSYYRCDYRYLESKFGVKTDFTTLQNLLITQTEKSSTMVVPVRSSQINTDAKLKFEAATFPDRLTYPFSIPANAKKISMDMFE